MSHAELLIALLAAVSVLVALARRWDVAAPILLFVGGSAAGSIPGLPQATLQPDLVFLVFLPPLLYYAAFVSSPRELRSQAVSITLLAVGLVLATLVAVAAVAHATVPGLPWAAAFALGALLSPTDPVAATSVIRRVGAPPNLITVLEGESLVNDGIGLVAYKLALTALATGAFSLVGAAGRVAAVSAGGIAVGLVVGWLVARLRRRLDDAEVEITISLLTPYAAYILAERIGASGVLATVAAGLYLGSTSAGLFSPQVRLQAQAFWSTLAFLLNSVLFLLVGLQFRRILQGIATDPVNRVAGAAAGVALTVVLVRILWQELMPRGTLTRAERLAVGWSGMRGAVSLAAALALPLDVPRRDLLLFLTFCTVFVTLVVQGLTLPALLRRLGVAEADEVHRREVRARRRVVHSALGRLEELAAERDVPEAAVERLRERYEGRLAQLDATLEDVEADTTRAEEADAYRDLREDLIDVQRSTLTKLQRRGAVDASTAQRIGRELDLDQVRQYESR